MSGVVRRGGGCVPPPGPVKSMDFRVSKAPIGPEPPPPGKRNIKDHPVQIPDYALLS